MIGATGTRDGTLGLTNRLVEGGVEAAERGRFGALLKHDLVVVVARKREEAIQALSVVLGATPTSSTYSWSTKETLWGESGFSVYTQ